jgi:PAS domain S-box-containing protein
MTWPLDSKASNGRPKEREEELARLAVTADALRSEVAVLKETVRSLEHVREACFELHGLTAVGLLVLDQQGTIQSVNQAAATLLGATRAHLVGEALHMLLHVGDRVQVKRHFDACVELNSNLAELRVRLGADCLPIRMSTRWVHTSNDAFIFAALVDDAQTANVATVQPLPVEAKPRVVQEHVDKRTTHDFVLEDLLDTTNTVRTTLALIEEQVDVHELLRTCVRALGPAAARKR